jgi:hypothetical protein
MMKDCFKTLRASKWLPWVGTAPFIISSLIVMFNGEVLRGLGILAIFGSMIPGIASGPFVVRILSTHLSRIPQSLEKRLSAALSAFGFLFLPALIGFWSDALLNTGIEMYPLGDHFLWACVGAGIGFCVGHLEEKNRAE